MNIYLIYPNDLRCPVALVRANKSSEAISNYLNSSTQSYKEEDLEVEKVYYNKHNVYLIAD